MQRSTRSVLASFAVSTVALAGVVAPSYALNEGVTGPQSGSLSFGTTTTNSPLSTNREIFREDFSDSSGSRWIASPVEKVHYSAGMVTIKGGGPENRILSQETILASSFTETFDLYLNAGHTNAAAKMGFLASVMVQIAFSSPMTGQTIDSQLIALKMGRLLVYAKQRISFLI